MAYHLASADELDCSGWLFDYNKTKDCPNLMFIDQCKDGIPDRPSFHYSNINAVWVLTTAIIVFFMKAGFMLVEVSFASTPNDRRHVIILKHQDAFASAFGFFLFGFDMISRYHTPYYRPEYLNYFVSEPGLWFFKFTFASNAATIVGGCLITNTYKMRIPAAFISAFVISAFIHPGVARIIWSDGKNTFSPYKFCHYENYTDTYSWKEHCNKTNFTNFDRWYVLDFAGGGAVHGIGGIVGLVLCLFVKLQEWIDKRNNQYVSLHPSAEERDVAEKTNFWKWMYPDNGGDEATVEAALGVLILWFCWFAFNCGSTENMEGIKPVDASPDSGLATPYHRISGIVAVNMIMAGASGGVVAVSIAVWAQDSKVYEDYS